MWLGLVPIDVEVPGGLGQLQFHALHTLVEEYLTAKPGVLAQKWRHIQQVVLLLLGLF